ncbi:hypothetical protein SAMN05444358_103156 [Ruegeria halocynthiae]|uniref:Uncharacterized protein n=1 Tax=Ruegeria halocynthiae TaxID=985054 RepID=A0A1H2ZC90_9RHOB|nr:hypothetical protein [Ruegeria halocynthiae]SDX14598.1 hypothetical protein SAMN05444358_103156 [Ruegeria halocynthiae]
MPLEILLVLVVGGIAGVTLLLHLTGRSRLHELTPKTAQDQWLRHFPNDSIIDVTVATDGHAALVRIETGAGLLWSFGADTVARHLLDFDRIDHPQGFEVQFHDFSTPRVVIHLDETERRHWQHLMEPA